MIFLFDILSPSYLILASIDRILITSRNVLTRQRSTPRLAYICFIIITLFWLFFHIHALILSNLVQFTPDYVICYFQSGIYLTLIGYYSLIFKGILIPLLMITSGLWAVKNVRSAGRAAPVAIIVARGPTTTIRRVHAGRSKDRQLLQILLIDICSFIFFNLVLVVIQMCQQFIQDPAVNFLKAQIYALLASIGTFSTLIPFYIGCYTNLLVSKTFRHEVKNILMCK